MAGQVSIIFFNLNAKTLNVVYLPLFLKPKAPQHCQLFRHTCFYPIAYSNISCILKKLLLPFLLPAFISLPAISQNTALDSLPYYAALKPDTPSINHIVRISFNNRHIDFDRCIVYSDTALLLSKKIGFAKGQARSLSNLGSLWTLKANYPKALDYYFKSLEIWEKVPDDRGVMMTKLNIGEVYGYLKDTTNNYRFLKEAEAIALEKNYKDGLSIILNNFTTYYCAVNKFSEALQSQTQAAKLFQELGNHFDYATALNNTGSIYFFMGKSDSALVYYIKAKDMSRQLDHKKMLAMSMMNEAEMYLNKKEFAKAEPLYHEAIDISLKHGLKDMLQYGYQMLGSLYEQSGKKDEAIGLLKKYDQVKDSIYNENSSKQIAELQTKYETVRKEQQIQSQQFDITRKNYWLMGTGSLLILGGLLGISWNRRFKLKKEKQLTEEVMRQQDLATKAVLEAEENERKRIAGELHDGVGQMMSAARMNLSAFEHDLQLTDDKSKERFERIISLVDDSCKEVRIVSHNMMPNALLKNGLANAVRDFVDKIDNRVIKVDLYSEGLNERIDSNTEAVLYRVIQECVNNVIKHSGANHLDISLIKEESAISVTIEDNGNGFDATQKENFEGIGLKNILTRIHYLKGEVEFDSRPGSGTLVAIHVPIAPTPEPAKN